jgi:hypothetical protein
LLIAQAHSGLRQQQLVTCDPVQLFLVWQVKEALRKLATNVSTFLFSFLACASMFIYHHNVYETLFFMLIPGKSEFSTVKFIIAVFFFRF